MKTKTVTLKAKTASPKAKLLLGAGLDILHFESQEWLDTISFWKDEIRFFENLLNKKESEDNSKQDYSKMLKNLDKIHVDFFEDIEDNILEHEKLLARLEKGEKGLADNFYREKHSQLTSRMETFTGNFKTFKKIVFEYVKNL
jgi:hypothetical protein